MKKLRILILLAVVTTTSGCVLFRLFGKKHAAGAAAASRIPCPPGLTRVGGKCVCLTRFCK